MARVLFLGGLGRSGTTLLERVLGELPGVCALGEVVHLWQRDVRDDERCGCGERFSGCDVLAARSASAAFGGWDRVDVDRVLALRDAVERTRHIPRLAGRPAAAAHRGAASREYAGYYAAVYRAAAEVSGAERGRRLLQAQRAGALPALAPDDSTCGSCTWCGTRAASRTRGPRRWPGPRPTARDEMTRYSPGRSALLWNAHNAAFGLLAAPRRAGAPDALRGVPGRPARHGLRELAAFAGLDADRRRPGLPRRRARRPAPSGTAPPATRCASPSAGCRCAATTPGAARCRAASAAWSAPSARPLLRGRTAYPLRPRRGSRRRR